MLELSSLLLQSWTPLPSAPRGGALPPSAEPVLGRLIVNPADGATVGSVRQRPIVSSWKFWRPQSGFDVFEMDDHPLLFSVQRIWSLGRFCDVRDAEGHLVGRFDRGRVQDAYGWGWAAVERDRSQRMLGFRDRAHELAALTAAAGGDILVFRAALGANPFSRMLVLAAALAEGWPAWQQGGAGTTTFVSGRGASSGMPSVPGSAQPGTESSVGDR